MTQGTIEVGRIIRSSTMQFAVGCQVLRPQVPVFGALVKVQALGDDEIYGLIHDVRIEDDPFVRQMATTESLRPEIIEDQRRNRQVPIEVAVLVAGYRHNGAIYHRLPPQPPLSLDVIHTCDGDELVAFTECFDYFRLVLDSRDVPADELLAANLRYAAAARDDGAGQFMLEAGRELARLLSFDLARLDALLRRIRP
ncbi:MAG: hypothetical protein PVI09_13350 [Anaerolineae bacterium]|jgi:hypothetical protein